MRSFSSFLPLHFYNKSKVSGFAGWPAERSAGSHQDLMLSCDVDGSDWESSSFRPLLLACGEPPAPVFSRLPIEFRQLLTHYNTYSYRFENYKCNVRVSYMCRVVVFIFLIYYYRKIREQTKCRYVAA